jgi:predicted small secreted protein
LANVGNHEIRSKTFFRVGLLFCCSILFSLPAAAQSYPISGVWVAIDPQFSKTISEMCIALKAFGTEAVANNLIAEITIFDQNKRFDVRADATGETIIKSIKAVDGGFRITETFSKGTNWLGFKRKISYFLIVIDPQTIEIRDARTFTRYTKCEP